MPVDLCLSTNGKPSCVLFCQFLSSLPPPPPHFSSEAGPPQGPGGKVFTSRAADMGFEHFFAWSSHTSDPETGSLVASLPSVWHERVSTRTGLSIVSLL